MVRLKRRSVGGPGGLLAAATAALLVQLPTLALANLEGEEGGHASHLDADDPDFSGVVDFSNAVR